MTGTPLAEYEIDMALVQRLLAEQCPDLAYLSVQFTASGWDNVIFRLGNKFCVRLPRRASANQLIANEQTYLPRLVRSLPIPVPAAIRCGLPTAYYPWKWSVLPWIDGIPASHGEIDRTEARRFARFLKSLHTLAPPDAPHNPVRGVPLMERAAMGEARMQRLTLQTDLITPTLLSIWQSALNAPLDDIPRWLHGDLHPGNILVANGIISGIIDWGDITAGDIATDLAAIWMLFEDQGVRHQALSEYANVSSATLQRAFGWAILFGVMLLEIGRTDTPVFARMGENTLRRVCEDGESKRLP